MGGDYGQSFIRISFANWLLILQFVAPLDDFEHASGYSQIKFTSI